MANITQVWKVEGKGADKITCIAFPTRTVVRHGALYKPAAVCNLEQPVLPYHPSIKSSSIGRPQLYVKKNSHAASITNKVSVSNISANRRAPLQISPPYSSTAFASPSRPWISIPIDRRSEGLLVAENRRQTFRKRTEASRRMSFVARHPAMTTD
jgi:hypothetical protein